MAPKPVKQNLLDLQAKYAAEEAAQYSGHSGGKADADGDMRNRRWGHSGFESRERASREAVREDDLEMDWRAKREAPARPTRPTGRDENRSTPEADCDFGSLRSSQRGGDVGMSRTSSRRGGESDAKGFWGSSDNQMPIRDDNRRESRRDDFRREDRRDDFRREDRRDDFRREDRRDDFRREDRRDDFRREDRRDDSRRDDFARTRASEVLADTSNWRKDPSDVKAAPPAAQIWSAPKKTIPDTSVRTDVGYSAALETTPAAAAPAFVIATRSQGTSVQSNANSIKATTPHPEAQTTASSQPIATTADARPRLFIPSFKRREMEQAAINKSTLPPRSPALSTATSNSTDLKAVDSVEPEGLSMDGPTAKKGDGPKEDTEDAENTKKVYRRILLEQEQQRRQTAERKRKEAEQLSMIQRKMAESLKHLNNERIFAIEEQLRSFLTAPSTNTDQLDFTPEESVCILPSVICAKVIIEAVYVNAHSYDEVFQIVNKFKTLLLKMFTESGIWRHKLLFLIETTRAANELQTPRVCPKWGLLEAVWDSLYFLKIIEQQYFEMWFAYDDDGTAGRQNALYQLTNWLSWLNGSIALPEAESDSDKSEEEV